MALTSGTPYDFQIKILMIGDSGVGKTCLLLRYCNDNFSPTFITTIGIDFKVKTIQMEGKTVKLQVWDTAGQERFRTITTSYFRGAQGILLVYDVTDRGSFDNVKNWMGQIQQHADLAVNKILIGNKADADVPGGNPNVNMKRVVSYEEGKLLASEFGIEFFETSAKTNQNVTKAFELVAAQVVRRLTADSNKVAADSSSANAAPAGQEKKGTVDFSSRMAQRSSKCCGSN